MEALLVLDATRRWHLTPSGWARLDEALGLLEAAVDDADTAGVRRALAIVSLCGPARVSRSLSPQQPPEPAQTPAPPATLEIINRIVRTIAPRREEPDPR
jgi:hypothetical protein